VFLFWAFDFVKQKLDWIFCWS